MSSSVIVGFFVLYRHRRDLKPLNEQFCDSFDPQPEQFGRVLTMAVPEAESCVNSSRFGNFCQVSDESRRCQERCPNSSLELP
jgi:hypothetical protein